MVMETPSPQCVGREFVRQYYTLLHKAPMYLHRFYSHNSSFVHGGVEKPGEEHPPVTGQADIHKKILSLNFCDCHAKIRQVDSQATVGSAVVVQVTGELSNCGQPMRRFMQTFVLAPQSPKKYYVHNDIFRYQDEVFHDSDGDGENPEEVAGDSETELMDEQMGGSNGEAPSEAEVPYFAQQPPQPHSNGDVELEENVESADEPVEKEFAPSPVEPEDIEPETPSAQDTSNTSTEPSTDMYTPPAVEAKPAVVAEPQEPLEEATPEVPKLSSWASIISGNKSSGSVPPPQVNQAPATQPAPSRAAPPRQQDFATKSGGGDQAPSQAPQPQRTQRPPRTERREREDSRGGDGDDSRIKPRLPDSHQLFVGNLPHSMTEKELKAFFEQYGAVVDVRINRKSAPRDVPNFGFVVFDNPESVQQVLDQKPIIINGEHRLNVEEKKQRVEMGGRPGSGTRAGGRGGMGGPQSRGGGPGGVMGRGGRGGGPPPRMSDNRGPSGGGGGPQNRGGFGPRR